LSLNAIKIKLNIDNLLKKYINKHKSLLSKIIKLEELREAVILKLI